MPKKRRETLGERALIDQWAIPSDLEFDVGEDCIFIEEKESGDEVWFRLRDDYFVMIMDTASDVNEPPWTNLIEAYQVGLGRWGDEPWSCPDIRMAIEQIESAFRSLSVGNSKSALVDACRDLRDFVAGIERSGSKLWIDDGSGDYERFPSCG